MADSPQRHRDTEDARRKAKKTLYPLPYHYRAVSAGAIESPAEEALLEDMERLLPEPLPIECQHEVECVRHTFRLDLAITLEDGVFGLECDGKDYHSWWPDIVRDSLILHHSDVRVIYRIAAKHVFRYPQAVVRLIMLVCPELADERAVIRATAETQGWAFTPGKWLHSAVGPAEETGSKRYPQCFSIDEYRRDNPDIRRAYDRIQAMGYEKARAQKPWKT